MMDRTGVVASHRTKEGYKVLSVDTNIARYKGIPWKELGELGRRKFENLLIIADAMERIKVIYKP